MSVKITRNIARLRYLGDNVKSYDKISDDLWLLNDLVDKSLSDLNLKSRRHCEWNCRRCDNIWKEGIATRKRYNYCPNCQERKPEKCLIQDCTKFASFNYKQYKWPAYCPSHGDKLGASLLGRPDRLSGNNLLETHPELCREWHGELNEKDPSEFTYGSHYEAYWICRSDHCGCHIWKCMISIRTRGSKCPYCANRRTCPHNNLIITHLELCDEWDYDLNDLGPENYTFGADQYVHWICRINPCGCHRWTARISSRTEGWGCPYCSNKIACPHNNLTITHSELCEEWDYDMNEFGPEKYTYGVLYKAHWICINDPCGCHKWSASVSSRTRINPAGCPYCDNSGLPCKHDNLLVKQPLLCEEWDKNLNELGPENYRTHSEYIADWICLKGHRWRSSICQRTIGHGCPVCSKKGYSKAQIEWLEYIMKAENIFICHAANGGEYKIDGIGKVDGYCEVTNTVYEYHGDYWHGNPEVYHREGIHPLRKITFGELYQKTLYRDEKIRQLGFNLIIKWESE